jgi:signal transduction histidine kinase
MPDRIALAKRRGRRGVLFAIAGGVLALVAVAVLIAAIAVNRQAVTAGEDAARRAQAMQSNIASLVQGMVEVEAGLRGYALTQREEYLQPFHAGAAQAAEAEALLREDVRDVPALQGLFDKTVAARETALAPLNAAAALLQKGQRREGIDLLVSQDNAKRKMDAFRAAVDKLRDASGERVIAISEQNTVARRRIGGLFFVVIVLFGAAGGLASYFFGREANLLLTIARQLNVANTELTVARARAEEADAAKTRFLAMASHDMRQPLHALTLYLAALRRRVEGAQAQEILSSMEIAAGSLTRMFSGLLDLARIEAGVLKPNPMTFAVSDLLTALDQEVRADAKRANVTMRVVPCGAMIHTDPELLESILRNLLSNAIKYAPNGRVLLGCRRAGAQLKIEVRDEGDGMPEDKLVMIFGEFVRLDRAKAAAKEGLGLGLSIAMRLANLLGLRLDVSSKVGQGTAFWVTVPLAAANDAAEEHGAAAAPDLSGLLIAVQDDEPIALSAMARTLEDAGAEVHPYATSDKYVKAISGGADYDLVIGDPVLMRESGLAMRDLVGRVPPPAIIITGSTDVGTLATLKESGLAWLIKPIREETLLAEAARVARRKRVSAAR